MHNELYFQLFQAQIWKPEFMRILTHIDIKKLLAFIPLSSHITFCYWFSCLHLSYNHIKLDWSISVLAGGNHFSFSFFLVLHMLGYCDILKFSALRTAIFLKKYPWITKMSLEFVSAMTKTQYYMTTNVVNPLIQSIECPYFRFTRPCSFLITIQFWIHNNTLNVCCGVSAMESHRIHVDKEALKRTSELLGVRIDHLLK